MAKELLLLLGILLLAAAVILSGCSTGYDIKPLAGAKQTLPQDSAHKTCDAYARADKNITLQDGFRHCMAKHGWDVSF